MATARPSLTTTSYAILGLLAVRPWSSYELTKQMSRSLSHLWPRAESKLYEEPKKLVAQGLARAATRSSGQRTSTVYTITASGRRELKRWLATPGGSGPVLEFELMLKVFFSENGTRDDLLATIGAIAEWARARQRQHAEVADAYERGDGPFPERLPQTALVGEFLVRFADATAGWAEWATREVDAWPDDVSQAPVPGGVITSIAGRHRKVRS
jgi:PadR family transcriptional regulator, regulatory protein AphA